ncbi:MAG: QueT transporter family protein [Defluviitaleaceae bacterium]|nr:QueT transporter family protein [Defluviitaleaceae bacterium]
MTTKRITAIAMVAAIYAVLTTGLGIISYGPIQIRFAEILNLLAYFNPVFIFAVTLGTFIANMFSPYGLLDMIIGTSASFISLVLVWFTGKINNMFLASFWPVIINAVMISFLILIATETEITFISFAGFAATVGAGQFIVMILMAYPLFKFLTLKHERIIEMIRNI